MPTGSSIAIDGARRDASIAVRAAKQTAIAAVPAGRARDRVDVAEAARASSKQS
jgi:hypothetical protein